jgi:Xaa-Pro aminopeptidase
MDLTALDIAELEPMDIAGRLDRLRSTFDDAQIGALVVTHLTNIRYLTGFTGSAGLLVVRPDDAVLITDGRYQDQAPAQIEAAGVSARVEVSSTAQRTLAATAVGGATRLGLEADHVSWSARDRYDADWFPDADLVATSDLVEQLRLVKDRGEVARIRAACTIADEALAEMRPALEDGMTEREWGLGLDQAMRQRGASDTSFETIVASGPNGAMPHARPSGRRIEQGDLVVIDFGALVDGYCSDMTRTVMVGEPTDTQARMLEVVLAAQAAGVAAVAAGVPCRDIDAACRAVIAEAGWADAFTHGTGHGVGLDIHEAPRVGSTSSDTLAAGQVVTVEPGVYLEAHGGVRIEDTVVVTDDGAEALTLTPKLTTVA